MIEEADQLPPTTPTHTLILLRVSPAQRFEATSFDSIIRLSGARLRRLQAWLDEQDSRTKIAIIVGNFTEFTFFPSRAIEQLGDTVELAPELYISQT